MASEDIGGVSVSVNVDLSDLDAKFQAAVVEAGADGQKIGQAIADGINQGASGADAFQAALDKLVSEGNSANDAFQKLTGSTQTFVEALQSGTLNDFADNFGKITSEAQQAAPAIEQVASAAKDANTALGQMSQSGAGGFNLGDMFSGAKEGIASFGADLTKLEGSLSLSTDSIGEMGKSLLELGGIAVGLAGIKELWSSMVEATDSLNRADISLTALTGDADKAQGILRGLEELGMSDGLAMPGLRQAAITMEALLPAGTDIVGVLRQVADAAAVMGTSVEATASKLDRMVESGTLSARMIVGLGLTLDDIKTSMENLGGASEVASEGLTKAFKALDPEGRLMVVTDAMTKFQGVAEDVANNTFGGLWQQAANSFEQDMALMGASILPFVQDALPSIKQEIDDTVANIYQIKEAFQVVADGLAGVFAALATSLSGVGKIIADALSGNWGAIAQDAADAADKTKAAWKAAQNEVLADANATAAQISAIYNRPVTIQYKLVPDFQASQDQEQAAADMATAVGKVGVVIDTVSGKLPTLAGHFSDVGKSAALSMAQAEAAVESFDTKALSGVGTVGTLQAAFENAGKAIATLSKGNLPEVEQALEDYITVQGKTGASTTVLATGMDALDKALNQTGKTDATAAAEGFALLTKDLLDIGSNALPLVAAAFNNTEKQIAAIAKDAPDAALEMQTAFNAILSNSGASQAIMNDAFAKTDAIIKQLATQDAPQAVGAFITLAGSMKDAGDSVQQWSKPLTDAQATLVTMEKINLPDAATGFGILAQKMIDMQAPAQLVTDTFNLQLAAFQKMGAGGGSALQAAADGIGNLIQTEIKAIQPIGDVDKAFQAQQDIFTKMAAAGQFQGAIDGFNKLADAEKAFNPTGTEFVKTLDAERAALDLMAGQGGTGLTTAIGLLGQLAQKQQDLNAPAAEVTKTLDDERSKIDALAGQGGAGLTSAISLLSQLADQQVKLNQPTADVTKTLDDERSKIVALGASDVPAAIAAIGGLIAQQRALHQPLDDVNASLKVQSDLLAKEVNTDLPAAIAGHQQYLDQLNKQHDIYIAINAEGVKTIQQQEYQITIEKQLLDSVDSVNLAYGDRLKLTAQMYQNEINLGTAQGQNVEAQIWGLEKIKLAQDALVISTHGWADSETQALNDGIKGFENMGGAIANVVVNGGKMGDAIVADLKKIATTILTDLIDGALKQLAGALITLVTGVPAVITTITTGIGGVSAAATAAATGLTALGTAATAAATAISAAATAQASSSTAVAAAAGGEAAAMAAEVGADTAQTAATIADTSATVSDTAAQIADAAATGGEAAAMIAEAGTVVADTAATTADAAAKTADTGATIADTGATIADTGATIAQTAADIADTATVIADATAQAADTVAVIADTAATIAATAAQIAFASTVSAVAGIVGAIAGIVGDVVLHAIDEKLFSIETSTNRTANDLANLRADQWSQFGSIYNRMGEIEQDTHTMLATLQAMYGIMQGGGGIGGGLGASAQSDLDSLVTNTNGLMPAVNAIAYNVNAMAGYEQTMAPALSAIEQYAGQIYDFLSVMDKDINAITSAILYGGGLQTNALHEMSMSMQALAKTGGTSHPGQPGSPISPGQAPTQPALGPTLAQMTATAQAQLAAAQASAAGINTIATETAALRAEIAADDKLRDLAIAAGNLALAATYQQAAENATRELAPYLSATNTGLSQVNTTMSNTGTAITDSIGNVIVSDSQNTGFVVTAVNNSATVISNAVSGVAGAVAAAMGSAIAGLTGGSIPYTPGRANMATGPGSGGSTKPTSPYDPAVYNGPQDTGTQGASSGGPLGAYNPGPNPFTPPPAPNYGGIPGAYAPGPGYVAPDFSNGGTAIVPPPAGTTVGVATGPGAKAPTTAEMTDAFSTALAPVLGAQLQIADATAKVAATDSLILTDPKTGLQIQTGLAALADRISGDQSALLLQISQHAPPAMIDLLTKQLATDEANLALAQDRTLGGSGGSGGNTYSSTSGSTSISGTIDPGSPLLDSSAQTALASTATAAATSQTADSAAAANTAASDQVKVAQEQLTTLTDQLSVAEANNAPSSEIAALQSQIMMAQQQLVIAEQAAASAAKTADNTGLTLANTYTLINGQAIAANAIVQGNNIAVQNSSALLNGLSAFAAASKPTTGAAGLAATMQSGGPLLTGGYGYESSFGGGYGSGVPNSLPKFAAGGIMPYTGLAHMEAGEAALPPDLTAMLMRMASTPDMSYSPRNPAASAAVAPGSVAIGSVTFNVYGGSAADNVRQISAYMKVVSPKMAALSS